MTECPMINYYTDEEIKMEAEYEREFYNNGLARAARELDNAIMQGRLPDTAIGKHIIGKVFDALHEQMEEAIKPSVGYGGKYRKHLRELDVDTSLMIGLRTVLAYGSQPDETARGLAQIISKVGHAIETEIMARRLGEVKPWYSGIIQEQVREQCVHDVGIIKAKYCTAYKHIGYDLQYWTDDERRGVGTTVLNVLYNNGIFSTVAGNRKHSTYIVLSDEIHKFIEEHYDHIRPMIQFPVMKVKPLPWNGMWNGGYFIPELRNRSPMMKIKGMPKESRKWILDRLGCDGDIAVRTGMTKAQETPYRVNKRVLEVARLAFANPKGILGLPPHGPRPKPEFPFPDTWDKETATEEEHERFTRWKADMKEWYTYENTRAGQKAGLAGKLRYLSEIQDFDRWYCPAFIDWRGRVYFRSTVNPQSADVIKGCIDFAEGKELGEEGLFWLKVHVANCCGYDKKTFELRAKWTDEHWDEIKAFLDNPLEVDPPEVDTAFTLLQAGWDLERALSLPDPTKHISHVPVAMDATCSGLQHYSAMLRDEVGGYYTNLVISDSDEKHDIYKAVAVKAMELLPKMTNDPVILAWWQEHGVPRSMAKRPVMTYVYSATLRSCIDYVTAELSNSGVKPPEGYSYVKFCTPIGKALRAAVEATVPKAKEGMDTLKKLVRDVKEPLKWITPVGVPVVNYKDDFIAKYVQLNCMGIYRLKYGSSGTKYNILKAQNGISPNFIHSMDSSHLIKVVNAFDGNLLCIHDSFGTHACDVSVLRSVLLKEFVDLYMDYSPKDHFILSPEQREELQFPTHGTLCLENVLNSTFAFC